MVSLFRLPFNTRGRKCYASARAMAFENLCKMLAQYGKKEGVAFAFNCLVISPFTHLKIAGPLPNRSIRSRKGRYACQAVDCPFRTGDRSKLSNHYQRYKKRLDHEGLSLASVHFIAPTINICDPVSLDNMLGGSGIQNGYFAPSGKSSLLKLSSNLLTAIVPEHDTGYLA